MKITKRFTRAIGIFFKHVFSHAFDMAILSVFIFFFLFTAVGVFGWLPSDVQKWFDGGSATASKQQEPAIQYENGQIKEVPTRVLIPKVGIDVSVSNPQSATIAALDEALKKGAVRYPGSGLLNETANVFLFGHSAYSKTLQGAFYRTFNGVEKLQVGDEIRVEGAQSFSLYRVVRISFLKDSEAVIDLDEPIRMLTLSTCNAFGKKEDRVVVQAAFVRSGTK